MYSQLISKACEHPALHSAEQLARHAHRNMKRKFAANPYIDHPEAVFKGFCDWIANRNHLSKPELAFDDLVVMGAACWLHDVREDCQHTNSDPFVSDQEIIEACGEYGERCFALVCELTNPSKSISPRPPRAKRKRLDRLHLARTSWMCRSIKAIDRYANLGDLESCDDSDFLALYCLESRRLFTMLHDLDLQLIANLRRRIQELERRIKEMDILELEAILKETK